MRVRWIVEDVNRPGGVEAVVRTLDEGMKQRGIDSAVVSWLPSGDTPAQAPDGSSGWLRAKSLAALRRARRARQLGSSVAADLRADSDLMVVLDPGSMSVARHLVGVPRWGIHIHWAPELILEPWKQLAGDRIPRPLRRLVALRIRWVGARNRQLLRRAPFIVSLTRSHAQDLRRLGRPVHEIPNPLDVEPIVFRAARGSHAVVTLGYVGRLAWEKGPDVLLNALAMQPGARGGTRLVIAGSGVNEVAIRQQVLDLRLDQVEFRGWVADPRSVLEEIDVLVLPSRLEAVPLVLVEALAAGCVVVAAEAGSGVLDVLEEGHLGRVVPVDDPPALMLAIEAAVADVRAGAFPDRSDVLRAVSRHAPDVVMDEWTTLYDDLVQRRRI